MTARISLERAFTLLDEVVKEAGDGHVQDYCAYAEKDVDGRLVPGCIVGRVLHKAGVPVEVLAEMDNSARTENKARDTEFDTLVMSEEYSDAFTINTDAMIMLREAQRVQDCRKPWGEAAQQAREYHEARMKQREATT